MGLQVQIYKKVGNFVLDMAFETDGTGPEVIGLLGASGCGKSCTLRCVAGIERPDRGRIILDGVTLFDSGKGIDLPPQKRRIGYLFQNYALFPNMTVEQNILSGLAWEKNPGVRKAELSRILSMMQLEGLEGRRPCQLSGGQAQRAALARILVNRPRLIMLDEPFCALDSHLREKLQFQVKEILGSSGRTALLVTHSWDEACHLCHRVGVMDKGRLLTVKGTKALFTDPESICAALLTGCKNIAPAYKSGEHEVEVPDWGVRLRTAQPVREGVQAVAIRAHHFAAESEGNRAAVEYLREMREPIERIVEFRWKSQPDHSAALWWRGPVGHSSVVLPGELGVDPANVLLLYQ